MGYKHSRVVAPAHSRILAAPAGGVLRCLQPRVQSVLVSYILQPVAPLLLLDDTFEQVQLQLGWLHLCI